MRYKLFTAVLLSAALAAPALACLGPQSEATIFFNDTFPPPDAEFITGVVIESVRRDDAIAVVSTVIKAPANTIKTGDRVKLEFAITSCGPNLSAMDSGTISARRGIDPDKMIVLQPYIRSAEGALLGVAKE